MAAAKRPPSSVALARAQSLVPLLAEMIENSDPSQDGLDFNQIEASAAGIGDVLARLLMKQAVERRPAASEDEIEDAYQRACRKADLPAETPESPHTRKVRRMRRERTLKTVRGPVTFDREYLYFPGLKTGVFPPRRTPGPAPR
jgi:hypothetical protein